MRIHVDADGGLGTGQHLLLVHGFLSSRAQWRLNLEELKRYFRPVLVELWGHGRSPTPDDPAAYRVSSYIEAFEAIRNDLGIDRWLVCGQSFAAGLTIRYAHEHPAHAVGHIFTNSVSALSPPDGGKGNLSRLASADSLEIGGRAAIEALPVHPRHAHRLDSGLKQEMLNDAGLISPVGVANALRYTAPELSVIGCLGKVTVPGLLVNGVWEKSFQPLRARATELAPTLEVADLEAGHAVNAEVPELFNEAVIRFARSLK